MFFIKQQNNGWYEANNSSPPAGPGGCSLPEEKRSTSKPGLYVLGSNAGVTSSLGGDQAQIWLGCSGAVTARAPGMGSDYSRSCLL